MGNVDPEIHGVRHSKIAIRKLIEQLHLDRRMGVCKKDDAAVGVGCRSLRRWFLHDAEFGEERFPLVHVIEIPPAPCEGAGVFPQFQAIEAKPSNSSQNGAVFIGPIATHGR